MLLDFVLASDELKSSRTVKCMACESLRNVVGLFQCKECGCLVSLKTALVMAKCPKDSW